MLQILLAGCDEIPAYAGMTMRLCFGKSGAANVIPTNEENNMLAAPLFLFKPNVTSFQRKLESA